MTTTTNLALNEPAYNSTSPTWDQPLNYNSSILDQMFGATTGVSVNTGGTPTYTNITAPSATAAGSTSQAMRFNLTGALAANQTVLLPQGVAGMWVFTNSTTGAYTISIGSNNGSNVAAGTTAIAPQGYNILLYSDGTNVKLANDGGVPSPLLVSNGGTGSTSLTANNVILGNGTSAVQFVAPGANGNILTSNGTTWASVSPSASSISGALVKISYLTSGTSFTTQSTTNHIYVECVGGGGGGGTGTNPGGSGGGGGGGYSAKYFSVSPSTSYSYVIGSGGTGGSGSNGGSTTFTVSGVTITGGGGSYAPNGQGNGGAGGIGSGGDFNFNGGGGGSAVNSSGTGAGGTGGSSFFGGGAAGSANGSGAAASAYGGGGGGGGNGTGGNGYQGVIRVTEYT